MSSIIDEAKENKSLCCRIIETDCVMIASIYIISTIAIIALVGILWITYINQSDNYTLILLGTIYLICVLLLISIIVYRFYLRQNVIIEKTKEKDIENNNISVHISTEGKIYNKSHNDNIEKKYTTQ